jgi:hypothetical protein
MVDPPQGGGVNRLPTVADRLGDLASWSPIITNGTLAPPMTSFATSKASSKSVDATSAHDETLVGGASLNGGIILMAVAVERAFVTPTFYKNKILCK